MKNGFIETQNWTLYMNLIKIDHSLKIKKKHQKTIQGGVPPTKNKELVSEWKPELTTLLQFFSKDNLSNSVL